MLIGGFTTGSTLIYNTWSIHHHPITCPHCRALWMLWGCISYGRNIPSGPCCSPCCSGHTVKDLGIGAFASHHAGDNLQGFVPEVQIDPISKQQILRHQHAGRELASSHSISLFRLCVCSCVSLVDIDIIQSRYLGRSENCRREVHPKKHVGSTNRTCNQGLDDLM